MLSVILLSIFGLSTPQPAIAQQPNQDALISLSFKNAILKQVLADIESKSGFVFMYDANKINANQRVSIEIVNKPVKVALDNLFSGLNITYSINGKQIALNKTENIKKLKTVSGRVTDEKREPLPGVSVIVKGTQRGTITNQDGYFTMNDVDASNVLVFTFIGMQTKEVEIGNNTTINVVLVEEVLGLKEIVVTAFGINRETKQLTYVTQQISGEQLSATGNSNVIKGLQGKIAGVTVRQLSGMPGESSKITIRGSTSITGDNTPIYVVDGFPVGTDIAFKINPNEIASISVLKGAAAAALYGLRASNGVVIINTKRGEDNKLGKSTVTINTIYNFDRLSIYPQMQKIYAQGENFVFNANSAFSWGPRIADMGTYTNILGEQEEARAYDNIGDFFRTGGTLNTNVNISNRFDRGNYSIGISSTNQQGIVENTDNNVYSFKLSGDYKLSDKLTFSPTINYSDNKTNQTSQSYGNSSLFYAAFNAPPSYNLKGMPTHVPGNPYQQINFRPSHDNIYWAREHNKQITQFNSFIGSVGLNFKATSWLDFNYRFGVNQLSSNESIVFELGSGETNGRTDPPSGGSITERFVRSRDLNSNLNMIIKKKLWNDFDVDFLLGHEFYDMNYKRLTTTGKDLLVGGFHSLSNASSITSGGILNRQRSYGIFSNLNLGYKDMIFLNVSGRNDVVSNMPRNNRSFFYPSIGAGFIFTELFKTKSKILSFGKIRASYAEVGQAGPIYATNQVYTIGTAFTFPYDGITSYQLNNSIASANLTPQNTKTNEYGITLNFLNNRIKVDYSYFTSVSEGQILNVPIPTSTGFTNEMMNAGIMDSKGHEVILGLTLLDRKDFSWDISANYTAYKNTVVQLANGVTQLGLGGFRVGIVAEPGQEYPVIRGNGFARDPESGKVVVDSREFLADGVTKNSMYGMPLRSAESSTVLGKVNPDFELSFMNTFRYKNLSLYAQIDWRQGGKLYSGSSRLAKMYGTHPETANREELVVEENALKGHFEGGQLVIDGINDIQINKGYTYYRTLLDGIAEANVYDASYIRVRELRFEYNFPGTIIKNTPLSSLSLFAVGNNLWLIKSGLPVFDPEMGGSTGNYQGEEYARYPQISSYGLGLNIKF